MRKNLGAKPYLYPQLVAILGTYNEDGTANAMNAAWGGIYDDDLVFVCLSRHKTTENMDRTGCFTLSIADAEHVVEADYLGIESGSKVPNKVEKAGLHVVKSEFVNAPLFEEFALALECEIVETNPHGVVGRIKNVSVDERILGDNGKIDPEKLQAISFDPANGIYLKVSGKAGNAFKDGNALK